MLLLVSATMVCFIPREDSTHSTLLPQGSFSSLMVCFIPREDSTHSTLLPTGSFSSPHGLIPMPRYQGSFLSPHGLIWSLTGFKPSHASSSGFLSFTRWFDLIPERTQTITCSVIMVPSLHPMVWFDPWQDSNHTMLRYQGSFPSFHGLIWSLTGFKPYHAPLSGFLPFNPWFDLIPDRIQTNPCSYSSI